MSSQRTSAPCTLIGAHGPKAEDACLERVGGRAAMQLRGRTRLERRDDNHLSTTEPRRR